VSTGWVWRSVVVGALFAHTPAFARGGGHGGGGHGGGGHAGGGHGGHAGGSHGANGRAGGGPRGGGTRDGHGSGSSHGSGGYGRGRIYLWVPPPIVSDGSQGMQCGGIYVVPGDSQDNVFRACGEPSAVRQAVYTTRDAERVVQVWTYERVNTTKRTLRFEDGMLTSIDSVGPMR
jgi:Protein of unknown function (DUF2845)